MTVTAATAASTTAPLDSVANGRNTLAQNFDMFLTLLTTQMKNQDPTSPLDSNQFTAQLVQMTGVEQQLAANDLLKQVVANTGTSVASAVDLIGKDVRASSADAKLSGGQAQWKYHLDADTADLKVEVLDSAGKTVNAFSPAPADSTAGDHTFAWNGKDAYGATMPDGIYTLRVTTKGDNGASVATGSVFVQGAVTGVEQSGGQTLLTINGAKVPLSQVTSVTATASAPTTTPTTTATTTTPPAAGGAASIPSTPTDQTSAAAA